jgi:preprotein translocase subunit secB
MKISKFQFSNPVLIDLKFSINNDYHQDSCQIGTRTTTNIQKSETENSAFVTVTMTIGHEGNDVPFMITIAEQARFMWESNDEFIDENEEECIDRLLRQNAPALLIGYIRPIIASITSSSPFPTYNLPFIDLTEKTN